MKRLKTKNSKDLKTKICSKTKTEPRGRFLWPKKQWIMDNEKRRSENVKSLKAS